jgi:glutathionylspermidine synthase
MERFSIAERPDWRAKAERYGFRFHTANGERYWDESVAWRFTLDEIERDLEAPTAELEQMCLAFVGRAVENEDVLTQLGIPAAFHGYVRDSWRRGDRNLYGRFDLAYDGSGPAKLLEYNADTPTSLFEAAVFQWTWLEDQMAAGRLPEGSDQFNSLHERLVEAIRGLRHGERYRLHLAHADSEEDAATVAYLADCAGQAGVDPVTLAISGIGVTADGRFTDLADRPIETLFKLYPWEWLFREEFARHLAGSRALFVEPAWKAALSTKALLPFLWEMAPNHPNLLPAYFSQDPRARRLADAVEKPIHSREGANLRLIKAGSVAGETDGPYGGGLSVTQALAPLARFEGGYAVIGSWVVASQPAGVGIREDAGPITRDTARFVPHCIAP